MDAVNWTKVAAYISAGLCMGIGAIGPSLGQGYVGGKACESMSRNPESTRSVFNAMIVAVAVTESSSIYAFIISLCLLFATV